MATASQTALAAGLAVLKGEHGEAYTCGAVSFAAIRADVARSDGLGGTTWETELTATRSLFSALPAEGSVITHTATRATFRLVNWRPGPYGQIVMVVRAEGR